MSSQTGGQNVKKEDILPMGGHVAALCILSNKKNYQIENIFSHHKIVGCANFIEMRVLFG